MAATLIHIKSRMLLPRDPELDKLLPEEDPRKELVEKLLERERFKNAAEMLHQKRVVEEAVWTNSQIEQFRAEAGDAELAVTLFDLVKTFQAVLDRSKHRPVYEVGSEEVSVPDMLRYLRKVFGRENEVAAAELFERQRSRRAMICLFLAVLELVKLQALGLTQTGAFGEIGLKRLKGFEAAFSVTEPSPQLRKGITERGRNGSYRNSWKGRTETRAMTMYGSRRFWKPSCTSPMSRFRRSRWPRRWGILSIKSNGCWMDWWPNTRGRSGA